MFFQSKKKDLFKQIDASFIEMKNECSSSVWEKIASTANNLVKKQGDKAVSFFENYPYTPRIWAITFASNFSGDILESGKVCAYRGVLSFEGEEYLKVFEYSTLKLAKEGIVPEYKAKENIQAVKDNISLVG